MGIEIGSFKFVRHTDVSARIFYIGAHRAGSPVVCFTSIGRPTQYGRKGVGSQMSLAGRQNLSRIQTDSARIFEVLLFMLLFLFISTVHSYFGIVIVT